MTITVARAALLPALGLAVKVVERRTTIPILANVLVEIDGGRMTLVATDLDQELRSSCDLLSGDKARFTLPAATLHDAVRKLPDGAEIAFTADEKAVTITSGRARFKLPALPATDFPTLTNDKDFDSEFTLPSEALAAILKRVGFAVSSEETRYYLNGIYWHVIDGSLVTVATDGHRLARVLRYRPEGADGMPAVILPRQALAQVSALISAKDAGDVKISVSKTRMRFETSAGALLTKLIDGTFPDYQRVIPTGNANRFTLAREALAHALDRVGTIHTARGAGIRFDFSEGHLKLAAANPDAGSADEEMEADAAASAAQVEIGFNGRYCLDALAATDAERIVFDLGGAGDPAVLRPEGDDAALFVLMPLRV